MISQAYWDTYSPFYDEKYHTANLRRDSWGGRTMSFQTFNNVSILPKNIPSKEYLRHPLHCIHQESASSQALCDLNPSLENRIFGDLISNNTSTYNLNEVEFYSGRVAVVFHLNSNNHSGVNINDLTSRLGVGRDTAIRTL